MSKLLKRSLTLLACGGVCASVLLAQGGTPSVPPVPSKDQVTDQAKDAAKEAMEQAKQQGEALKKQAEDAAKKAMGGDPAKAGSGAGGGMPDEKMMAEMMKGMQPGPMHEWLKKWEGKWDLVVKSFPSPGAPPAEMKLTSEATMAMGGRFLIERVWGEVDMGMGPQAFEGVSTLGYDNYQKKFVSTWYDNVSTGMMIETGTVDAAGKVLTMEGENWNMSLGAMSKTKSICAVVDDKTRTMEMWSPGPDGKMMKNMEITYTRK